MYLSESVKLKLWQMMKTQMGCCIVHICLIAHMIHVELVLMVHVVHVELLFIVHVMHESFVSTAPPPTGMGGDSDPSLFRALI